MSDLDGVMRRAAAQVAENVTGVDSFTQELISDLLAALRDLREERERLRELVAVHVEYEAFLNKANEGPIGWAWAHGWRCPDEDVRRGQEFRDRIAALAETEEEHDGR